MYTTRRSGSRRRAAITAGLMAVVAGLSGGTAHAGLGESVDSVARDHSALHGQSIAVTKTVAYDRHEMVTASGVHCREYASRDGTVFAVAWSGPTQPDLKVLLGSHYNEYLAAATAHHGGHHVLSVATPGLVLQITRLPRGFVGHAHVPDLVPAGTSLTELY